MTLASDQAIEACLEQGEHDQALALAEARLLAQQQDVPAAFYAGVSLFLLERAEESGRVLDWVLEAQPDHLRALNARAQVCLQQHDLDRAKQLLEHAIVLAPDDLRTNFNLGQVLVLKGDSEDAVPPLEKALAQSPDLIPAHLYLADCKYELHEYESALQHYQVAGEAMPDSLDIKNNTAACLIRLGNLAEAKNTLDLILEQAPKDRGVLYNLAATCQLAGMHGMAIEYFRKLYVYFPNDVEVAVNFGLSYERLGWMDQAAVYYMRAAQLAPDSADPHCYLGGVYEFRKQDEKAQQEYERCLEIKPDHSEALARLANLKNRQNLGEEAETLLRKAIEAKPDWGSPYLQLINLLQERQCFDEALVFMEKLESIAEGAHETLLTRASLLLKMGQIAKAMAVYRTVLEEQPRHPDAASGMLFCMNYDPELTPERLADAYKDWDRLFARHLLRKDVVWPNEVLPDRRLKVGFVSGDLRGHSVAFFLEPILQQHDKDKLDIYCYSTHAYTDTVTLRLMKYSDHWRFIHDLSDEAVLELLRLDEIDILIDLSNHTAHHRLYLFARKAAPIQMTWIGMPTTTGIAAIDYRITDARMDPVGMTESLHAEKLLRLPSSGWCYRPADEAQGLEVGELPALRNGHLSFASFNAFGKINNEVITLWARMFKRMPTAVLHMFTGGKDDESNLNDTVNETFEACGFPMAQLKLFGRKPLDQFYAFHQQIDIALDPFPYNGGTTTAHDLWMGVPVLTLAGRKPIQRMGVSMNTSVGLEQFIAQTPEEYVDIAVAFDNPAGYQRLAGIRGALRQNMQDSPLMNAEQVTRDLEDGLRTAWLAWCETQKEQASVPALA